MILIDSYGWIEYLSKAPLAQKYSKYFKNLSQVITPSVVIYEVYKKIIREKGKEESLMVLGEMKRTKIVPIDEEIALLAADVGNRYSLPMTDAFIYATALREGVKVVTSDLHFESLDRVIFIK